MVSVATGSATSVVSSNLGSVNPATNRPDGTDADYFAMKSLYPGMTKVTMHRAGGVLALLSGRAHGQVFVSALAYQPRSSNDDLRQDLSNTLNDFSLTGTAAGDALHQCAARSKRPIHDERVTPLPPPLDNTKEGFTVANQSGAPRPRPASMRFRCWVASWCAHRGW